MGVNKLAGLVAALLLVIGLLSTELNAKTIATRTETDENEIEQLQALVEAFAKGDKDLNQVDFTKLLDSRASQPQRTKYEGETGETGETAKDPCKNKGETATETGDDACNKQHKLCLIDPAEVAGYKCEGCKEDFNDGGDGVCVAKDPCKNKGETATETGDDACNKQHKLCLIDPAEVAGYKCEGCKEDFNDGGDGVCVANDPCKNKGETATETGDDACNKQHKLCLIDPAEVAGYKCEGCKEDFNDGGDGVCVANDPCKNKGETATETGDDACNKQHKLCLIDPAEVAGYKCEGCKEDFNDGGDGVCVAKDPCKNKGETATETGDDACNKQHKLCLIDPAEVAGYKCEGCKEDFNDGGDGVCVAKDPCKNKGETATETGDDACNKQHKLCLIDPAEVEGYKCEGCKEDFNDGGDGVCVAKDPCKNKGETATETGDDACNKQHKLCLIDPAEVAGYKCEGCKEDFNDGGDGVCVAKDPCKNKGETATETGDDACNKQHKLCLIDPAEVAGYKCEGCKEDFNDGGDGVCVAKDPCKNKGETATETGDDACNKQHKLCLIDPAEVAGYKCEGCKEDFNDGGDGVCVAKDPCKNKGETATETGDDACNKQHKLCLIDPAEVAGYKCEGCKEDFNDGGDGVCVAKDPCKNKGETATETGDDACNKQHKLCLIDPAEVAGYKCEGCKEDFNDGGDGVCVAKDPCKNKGETATETGDDACNKQHKLCLIDPAEVAGYKCEGCKEDFNDGGDGSCVASKNPCKDKIGDEPEVGDAVCDKEKKHCAPTNSSAYECDGCKEDLVEDKDGKCVAGKNPCKDKIGDEPEVGDAVCDKEKKHCAPTNSSAYECDGCKEDLVEDKDGKCVAGKNPCKDKIGDEPEVGDAVCDKEKKHCAPTNSSAYECDGCKEDLVEDKDGKCVAGKNPCKDKIGDEPEVGDAVCDKEKKHCAPTNSSAYECDGCKEDLVEDKDGKCVAGKNPCKDKIGDEPEVGDAVCDKEKKHCAPTNSSAYECDGCKEDLVEDKDGKCVAGKNPCKDKIGDEPEVGDAVCDKEKKHCAPTNSSAYECDGCKEDLVEDKDGKCVAGKNPCKDKIGDEPEVGDAVCDKEKKHCAPTNSSAYECDGCKEDLVEDKDGKCVAGKNPCKDKIGNETEVGDAVCDKEKKHCAPTNSSAYECKGCKDNLETEDEDGTCVGRCQLALKNDCPKRLANKCVMNGETPVCICPNGYYMGPEKCTLGAQIYVYKLPGINEGIQSTTTAPVTETDGISTTADATETDDNSNTTQAIDTYVIMIEDIEEPKENDKPNQEIVKEVALYASKADATPLRTELAEKIFSALKTVAKEKLADVKVLGDEKAPLVEVEAIFKVAVGPEIFDGLKCEPIQDNPKKCKIGDLELLADQKDAFKSTIKSANEVEDMCTFGSPCVRIGQQCSNEKKTETMPYECLCRAEGYETVPGASYENFAFTSEVCQDKDECKEDNTRCPNGECLNLQPDKGMYTCKCNEHFMNPQKDGQTDNKQCVDSCQPDYCPGENEKCTPAGNSHYCRCKDGYMGPECAHPIGEPETGASKEKLNKAESNVIIVGAVLGAVLLLTIIVAAVSIRKLRSKVNKQNHNNQPLDDFNSGRRGYDNAAGPR